ncbi:MAG: hypothetical protein JWN03_9053 [Nocardia sp.]|nr:hypothetical protein [Nocardia sp.]
MVELNVVASEVQEILNYFGKCPVCNHPSRAWHITARFGDGRVESQDIAECGGWCGWKGPVHPAPMTSGRIVLTKERNTIGLRLSAFPPSDRFMEGPSATAGTAPTNRWTTGHRLLPG